MSKKLLREAAPDIVGGLIVLAVGWVLGVLLVDAIRVLYVVLGCLLIACLYFYFARTEPKIHGGSRILRYSIRTRRFALISFFIILISILVRFGIWVFESTPKSVAILPFKQIGGQPGNEHWGLGMADALITQMGKLKQIIVRPTSSITKYIEQQPDPIVAGRELNVETVLEGSIQMQSGRIRVTVQLVKIRDGKIIWADIFDDNFADIFKVQDSISEKLADELSLKLTAEEKQQLVKRQTYNTEAFNLYENGRYLYYKRRRESIIKSIGYFKRAVEADPQYALAHAALANSYAIITGYGLMEPMESFPRAKATAEKALKLDETLAEAHTALGRVKARYGWDWQGAETEFKRAIALNPNYPDAHYFYALDFLIPMERMEEAFKEMKRALEIGTLSLIFKTNYALIFYVQRDFDEAIQQTRNVLDLDNNNRTAIQHLIDYYALKKMFNEAITEQAKITHSEDTANLARLKAAAVVGDEAYWKERYYQEKKWYDQVAAQNRKLQERNQQTEEKEYKEYVAPIGLAVLAARARDIDRAFEWLERAYQERDPALAWLRIDPAYDTIRFDPRYKNLLQRLDLK